MKKLIHPPTEQLTLTGVLEALSDPTRMDIVLSLDAQGESSCSMILPDVSNSNLAYHFLRLREAGVTRARIEGTRRFISLRRDDLEQRFPGLLEGILASAKRERAEQETAAGAAAGDLDAPAAI